MANPEHLEILKRGVEVWNRWREEHPEIKPDLSHACLRHANLIHADLSNADLISANLTGANLIHAELSAANILDANLIDASLIDVDLIHARLHGADLSNAELRDAYFGWTSIVQADLTRIIHDGHRQKGRDSFKSLENNNLQEK